MAKYNKIIEYLDFGFDVAENDINLSNYFIETEDFSTIKSGVVDIIRGHKGLGKSAIYKMLLSEHYNIPNTFIVNGSDASSSDIFKQTLSSASTEDQYRLLWTAYLSTLVANSICKMGEQPQYKKEFREVKEFIKELGLDRTDTSSSLLDKLKKSKSFAIGLGISEDGLPNLSFNVDFDNDKRQCLASEEHFISLLKICIEILVKVNKNVWILIDRVDELHQKNSENETLSLRGLLRSHLNICAINGGQIQVRPKIFMRTDIYERITNAYGFTNITHLRDLNIVWNVRSIVHLVTERVISNAIVKKTLVDMRVNVKDPNDIWKQLTPHKIQGKNSASWLARATSDATGAYNPRNFITLLSFSKKKTAELSRTNPQSFNFETALSTDALISSFGDLSRKRLDDTVLAEFPQARKYIDQLRGGISTFNSNNELKQVLSTTLMSDDEFISAIEILKLAGVLKQVTIEESTIAYLYRAALKTGNKSRSVDNSDLSIL